MDKLTLDQQIGIELTTQSSNQAWLAQLKAVLSHEHVFSRSLIHSYRVSAPSFNLKRFAGFEALDKSIRAINSNYLALMEKQLQENSELIQETNSVIYQFNDKVEIEDKQEVLKHLTAYNSSASELKKRIFARIKKCEEELTQCNNSSVRKARQDAQAAIKHLETWAESRAPDQATNIESVIASIESLIDTFEEKPVNN